MYKFKVVNIVLFLALSSVMVMGQNSTSSPYSRYGLGNMENNGFGRNKGMGGTGIALRNNANINPLNPASFTAIDSMSQIYEFGLMGKVDMLDDGTSTQYEYDVNISELGMAFPITRWMGFSMGIKPVSLIGYEYSNTQNFGFVDNVTFLYNGEGGITNAFAGIGVSPVKNLSLGASFAYYFGTNVYNRAIAFVDNPQYSNISTYEEIKIAALHPIFGLQYIQDINSDNSLVFGAVYEPATDLNAEQTLKTLRYVGGAQTFAEELESLDNEPIGMGVPMSYGVGLAYVANNQLTISGDYYVQNWKDAPFYGKTDTLNNKTKVSAGLEYIPNYLSQKYLDRVEYRLGSHYSNEYFKVGGQDIYDFGINFGVGLPLRYSKTRFNIAFEYGWVGTSDKSLINENYGKLTINFSFNNFWFIKRKFD